VQTEASEAPVSKTVPETVPATGRNRPKTVTAIGERVTFPSPDETCEIELLTKRRGVEGQPDLLYLSAHVMLRGVDPLETAERAIVVSESAPPEDFPFGLYRGRYYTIADTPWDRRAFSVLYSLFQMTVTDVSQVGLPITISK